MAEVRERLARVESEREQEARRRVAEERVRIARELHDVLAHTVTVITVQAGVAADVLADAPQEARDALGAIRSASREALAELQATVNVLRAGDGPRSPIPDLGQLAELAAGASGSGLAVEVCDEGDPRPVPAAVSRAAYRIVQEALTNVRRHAGATRALVLLVWEADALVVEVRDDGHAAEPVVPGNGLTGMAERAAALGGGLTWDLPPDGGFRVRAHLPAVGA